MQQPEIASSVNQQTKMEEPQAAVLALLGLIVVAYSDNCWMTGFIDLVRLASLYSDYCRTPLLSHAELMLYKFTILPEFVTATSHCVKSGHIQKRLENRLRHNDQRPTSSE